MPRKISLWLLIGAIALLGVLFFQVIKPYIVSLVIAIVLTVLFAPLHQWLTHRLGGYRRIAAGLTTCLVILLVLSPISLTLIMAGTQVMEAGDEIVAWFETESTEGLDETVDKIERTTFGGAVKHLYDQLSPAQQAHIENAAARISDGLTAEAYDNTRGLLSDVFTFVVSLCIMTLGLYYFLADRQLFVRELHRMLPLDDQEEIELIDRFQSVCRGVVLGTVVAGVVQSALAGLAFTVLDVPQVWILMVLTMFCSFIPFLGSAAVWIPVSLWLMIEGRVAAGFALMLFGAAIISTADNLVRAYVIGSEARLHPLIALVTVLGALKLMGLWGIFIGPMIAAFFYALLNITRQRILRERHNRPPSSEADAWQHTPPSVVDQRAVSYPR